MEGLTGLPLEMLRGLDTCDVPAIYNGTQRLKGKAPLLGGLPAGKLAQRLVNSTYEIERDGCAQNFIRGIRNRNLGFSLYGRVSDLSIEDRVNMMPEDVRIQFLRAFHSMRLRNPEQSGNDYGTLVDPVYSQYKTERGLPIDSKKSREAYVREFIRNVTAKWERGAFSRDTTFSMPEFNTSRFQGWIVPSYTAPNREGLFRAAECTRASRKRKGVV